jgi:putative N6-adenine-specific DNA methylase
MQETLAAGVIAAAGWDGSGERSFVNPMCGSGTLAIEAALLCMKRKPGVLRKNFGFMHYRCFDPQTFRMVRSELCSSEITSPQQAIIAGDISAQALEAAKSNSRLAGVDQLIEFRKCDVSETPVPSGKGIVLINPEYGFRMGTVPELETVYKEIGDFLKQRCTGYTGCIFTGNFDLIKKVGLKAGRKTSFFSGKIECRLYEYQLYSGRK